MAYEMARCDATQQPQAPAIGVIWRSGLDGQECDARGPEIFPREAR